MHYIYTITCIATNKKYVGQTTNPKDRWLRHKLKSSGCHKVRNSLNKYGVENHIFEVHVSLDTLERANEYEIKLIAHFNSVSNGLNIQEGGNKKNATKGRKMLPRTKETKQRISQAKIGKKWSDEMRRIQIEARKNSYKKGEQHPHYGVRGERASNSKITDMQRDSIILKYAQGVTQKTLASEYGLSQPHISHIIRTWRKNNG